MMAESLDINDFDKNVVKNLKEYGKKIKKYELVQILKKDFACSDLEINNSLQRLIDNKQVTKTDSNKYLLTEY